MFWQCLTLTMLILKKKTWEMPLERGTPGSGHVPWDDTFATLAEIKFKGWLTIEGFTRNDPDFANSIGVWRDFSEPWEMAENGYKFIKMMGEKHGL